MTFQQYLAVPNVIELTMVDKVDAFKELSASLCRALDLRKQKNIMDDLLKREESASTFIGQGIAIPHTRAQIKDHFAIVVGRSKMGIKYDAARGALAHILVLVVIRDDVDSAEHIQLLAELAGFYKTAEVRNAVLNDDPPTDLLQLSGTYGPLIDHKNQARRSRRFANPFLRSALTLARDIKASAVVVFADSVRDNEFLNDFKGRKHKLVVVTSNKSRFDKKEKRIAGCVQVPSFSTTRTGQIKIGILLALSRDLLSKEDTVICISGNSNSGFFDTLMVLDIKTEYEFFFTAMNNILPPDVKPEVLERILGLAAEIAVEGREGKPIGTIFVLGDTNTVNTFARQLIINPFRGYSEVERNIMDPGLDETIKEFSSIDGAFIITGDGVVLSAGSYLRPQAEIQLPPSGLGVRHAAAAGISACTKALAITVSESTGMVTLFKNGSIIMTLTRPMVRGQSTVSTNIL